VNIDIKSDDALVPTLAAVRAAGAEDRVCLAANSDRRLRRIRRLAGSRIATSSSAWEVILLMFAPLRRWRATGRRRGASSVQVPLRNRGVTVISDRFIRRAHELGLEVHVWVVDDETSARDLLEMGADGLIADRIDVLRNVLDDMAQ
jgi:glycerophosphoryl diester phosphodiesterase